MAFNLTRQSFVKEVLRDIDVADRKLRTKAAVLLVRKMKEKVSVSATSKPGSPPGKESGNLKKGIKYVHEGDITKVGVGPPASHAHLMEFGTMQRTVKNFMGKKGVAVDVGAVAPRPFMQPTFEENAEEVKEILSEQWV